MQKLWECSRKTTSIEGLAVVSNNSRKEGAQDRSDTFLLPLLLLSRLGAVFLLDKLIISTLAFREM
jgi:hypothetical protein